MSYEHKNNLANGENNQDGHNDNHSFNCGIEGETQDVVVNSLRLKQQKNALITLFMSCGVPMIAAGTELGHSQKGNNNAYCQDNDISWLNWDEPNSQDLRDFISRLIEIRSCFTIFKHPFYVHQEDSDFSVHWFDEQSQPMDTVKWHDPTSQFLMCRLDDNSNKTSLLLLLNASEATVNVSLPKNAQEWHLQITSEPSVKFNQIEQVLDISAQSSWVFSTNFEGNDNES